MEEPTVFLHQSFLKTKKGKIILVAIIAVLILTILATKFSYLFKKTVSNPLGTPVKITVAPDNGFKAGNVTFPCPAESAACSTQQLVDFGNSSAVIYKTSSGSGALNVAKLADLENIAVSQDQKTGKKYFYESVAKDADSCYTIAYTLPEDAMFGAIRDPKILETASEIATLGPKTFQYGGKDTNILIQIRETPLDQDGTCSLLKRSPDFFKAFN